MGQHHVHLSRVPCPQVVGPLVLPHAQALQPGSDTRHLVLKLIKDQHVLTGGAFHEFIEGVQFLIVNRHRVPLRIVDGPAGELLQLAHQGRGASRHHLPGRVCHDVRQLHHPLTLECFVTFRSLVGKAHHDVPFHQRGQFEVILRPHRQRDVADKARYFLLSAFFRIEAVGYPIPPVRVEPAVTKRRYRPPQPCSHIKAVDLRPQILQPVRRRRASQPHHALAFRPHQPHRAEAPRLRALEACQFVEHQHIIRPRPSQFRHKPSHEVAARYVNVRPRPHSRPSFRGRPEYHAHAHPAQVLPLCALVCPRRLCHLLRRHDQHRGDLAIVHQLAEGRQRRDRLTEAHVEE